MIICTITGWRRFQWSFYVWLFFFHFWNGMELFWEGVWAMGMIT